MTLDALDGNNSLKCFVREGQQTSLLMFNSDYFIPHEYVDRFRHKGKHQTRLLENTWVCCIYLFKHSLASLTLIHRPEQLTVQLRVTQQMVMLARQLVQINGVQLMLMPWREYTIHLQRWVCSFQFVDMASYGPSSTWCGVGNCQFFPFLIYRSLIIS